MSASLATAIARLHQQVDGEHPDPFDAARYEASLAVVRAAVARLGWGTMLYRCEKCSFQWRIWLSLGVEGPKSLRDADLFLASPYVVGCPAWPQMAVCEGSMRHVDWSSDESFDSAVLIPDDAARFVLPYSTQRGDAGATLEIPPVALLRARRAMNERGADE